MTRKNKKKKIAKRVARERRLFPFKADTPLWSGLSPKGYKPYFRMMDELSGLLLNAPATRAETMQVTRLMFRPLCRGEKKRVYMAMSDFCRSKPFARGWSQMVFARWLGSPDHSNLGVSAWTISRLINTY